MDATKVAPKIALKCDLSAIITPMHPGKSPLGSTLATMILSAALLAAQPGAPPLPEAARPAQSLIRDGRLDEALAIYKKALEGAPDSLPLHNALGNLLDLMGQSTEGHSQFARSIDLA